MMRAAIGMAYGPINEMVFVEDDFPGPIFDPNVKGRVLVRVLACALAPGDVRVLSGETDHLQGPPSFPYVIGGDVCGVVEQVCVGETRLKVGQRVVAQFREGPRGGCAQYCVVHTDMTEEVPHTMDVCHAAALGSSGTTAMKLARMIKPGERVLVLGGSGGVGTFLIQLLKVQGASFVVATSTQTNLVTSLGADVVIDYTLDDVWSMPEFKKDRFDTVIDLVDCAWEQAKTSSIVKTGFRGGRFITIVPPFGHIVTVHSTKQAMFGLGIPIISRLMWSRLNLKLPAYHMITGVGTDRTLFQDLLKYIGNSVLKVILDPASPLPFTTAGVREGMVLQESYHAHGKVVIKL